MDEEALYFSVMECHITVSGTSLQISSSHKWKHGDGHDGLVCHLWGHHTCLMISSTTSVGCGSVGQLLSVTNPKDFLVILPYICDNGFVHLRRMAITLAESWVKLLLGVTSILCHFRECDFTFIPSHPQSGACCTSRCRSVSNRVHNSVIEVVTVPTMNMPATAICKFSSLKLLQDSPWPGLGREGGLGGWRVNLVNLNQ